LVLFLFASLGFSRYNMIQQTANNAAFEAARTCVVPGASGTLTGNMTSPGAQDIGLSVLSRAGIKGGTVTVYDASGTNTSTVIPGSIPNTTTKIMATVTIPVSKNLWVTPLFLGSPTITKSCTLTID